MNKPPDWKTALAAFPGEATPLLEGIRAAGGRIAPDVTAALLSRLGGPLEKLMTDLLPLAATYAVPPVSAFHVGAIAAGPGDAPALYFGANFEFAGGALGFSVHAEQSAVNHAWLAGETKVARLAVTDAPCGHCRQFLYELASADELALLVRAQGTRSLEQLLPRAFRPDALGIPDRLLASRRQPLALSVPNDDPLVVAAREAAELSHAPYSRCPAGCALQVEGGRIQVGRTAESAAYNPTLTAVASAVSALVLRDGPGALRRITRVVVVEKSGPASQRAQAAAMASSCAPGARFDYFAAR